MYINNPHKRKYCNQLHEYNRECLQLVKLEQKLHKQNHLNKDGYGSSMSENHTRFLKRRINSIRHNHYLDNV